jgi:hypothetical protein
MNSYSPLVLWSIVFAVLSVGAVTGGEQSKGFSPNQYEKFMKSLEIIQPDPTLPHKRTRFSGIWIGTFRKEYKDASEQAEWWHVIEHILVIEKIYLSRVNAVYAFRMPGVAGRSNELHWVRLDGEFTGGMLRILRGPPADYEHISTYCMKEDGTLSGTRVDASGTYRGTLVKWRPQ